MLPRHHPDRIRIAFDDHRLVANAGLILPATLALHLGLPQRVDRCLDLGDAPGRANTGDKMMTLVASALAGGDCIDDADALRTGGTACALGCVVKAPSILGTFLRSFRWGHVRQLDRVSRELPARAGWVRRRRRTLHHRPRFDHLRDLRPGCARAAPTPPAAPPTSCGRRWGGYATPESRGNSRCGPTAASTLIAWYPSAARWTCASPSLSAGTKACTISSRPYPEMPGRRFLTGWTAPPMWPRPPTEPVSE